MLVQLPMSQQQLGFLITYYVCLIHSCLYLCFPLFMSLCLSLILLFICTVLLSTFLWQFCCCFANSVKAECSISSWVIFLLYAMYLHYLRCSHSLYGKRLCLFLQAVCEWDKCNWTGSWWRAEEGPVTVQDAGKTRRICLTRSMIINLDIMYDRPINCCLLYCRCP